MGTKALKEPSFKWEGAKYMSLEMQEYFQCRLLAWHGELKERLKDKAQVVHESMVVADDIDAVTYEIIMQQEMQSIHNDHYLLVEVEEALKRLEEGRYGYCEVTEVEIGFRRLEAWPIARVCIEAQEIIEDELFYENSIAE